MLPWVPREPSGDDWFGVETERRAAACYDYVLVWDQPDAPAAGLVRSFVPVYSGGRLRIWANRAGVRKRPPAAVLECLAGDA
jgi:hypothetical protein